MQREKNHSHAQLLVSNGCELDREIIHKDGCREPDPLLHAGQRPPAGSRDGTMRSRRSRTRRLSPRPGKPRSTGLTDIHLTVAAAADRWLATRIATGRNAHNQRKARARAETYLKPFMGQQLLTKVTANDLREYRIWLEQHAGVHGRAHLATTTIAWILGDARNLFYWAVDSGLIDKNPVPRRLLPRIQERPPDHLSDDDVAAVLSIAEPHAFLIRLALGTGMRWSELCRAQTTDLQDGMLVVHHTKSGRLRRVPLDHVPDLHAEIERHSGRLCPHDENAPGNFATLVRRLSGVQDFRMHRLRHTFAVHWLRCGGSLAVLQYILGHATVAMTQRYAKLTDEHVRAESKRLGADQT